jgi:hypothetical protein
MKALLLVFIAMTSAFVAESYQGDRMTWDACLGGEGETED